MKFVSTVLLLGMLGLIAVFAVNLSSKKVPVDATAKIRTSLAGAQEVFVYEGLPHQMIERELLKKEKQRDDTTVIGGFPFYTPKVLAKKDVTQKLRDVLASAESYEEFSGEKRCGGFHPDYAVHWVEGESKYSILICYGCGEALIVSAKKSYRYDLKKEKELRELLKPFASKRPASRRRK